MQMLDSLLAEHLFFKELAPEYHQIIAGCASNVRFDAGQFIFHEGEAADRFYVIRHGKVALEIQIPGRGTMTIQTIGAGEILGWSWLIPPYRWRFDARSIELTRAIALDGACLRGKCEQDHDLGYELMKRFAHIMMERLQATRLQILDVYGAHA
jgi:CRP-like cAMP-binding protein